MSQKDFRKISHPDPKILKSLVNCTCMDARMHMSKSRADHQRYVHLDVQSTKDKIHNFEVSNKSVDPKMHNIKFVQISSSLEEQINVYTYFFSTYLRQNGEQSSPLSVR